jgi:hypothetical protein
LGEYAYTYDESYYGANNDDAWIQLPTSGGLTEVGVGYLISSTDDPNYMYFEGTFNSGDVNLNNLSFTNPEPAYQGFNLVANPYPSALDWNLIDRTNIVNGTWIWDDNLGSYATWDGTTGVNGGTQYIPAMQGFFVKASDASNSLNFEDADRTVNTQAFKSDIPDLLKLTISGNGMTDEIALYFSESDEDLVKFPSSAEHLPQIWSVEDNMPIAINKLQNASAEQTVSLGISCDISGSYLISANEYSFENTDVILEDTQTNVFTELSQDATYGFEYEAGEDTERFILHFNPSSVSASDMQEKSMRVYASDNILYVKNSDTEIGIIEIINMLGQSVYKGKLQSETYLSITTGIYIVKIDTNNEMLIHKIIVK